MAVQPDSPTSERKGTVSVTATCKYVIVIVVIIIIIINSSNNNYSI
jgi:hypothetical protein